jgi:hypothetical protein
VDLCHLLVAEQHGHMRMDSDMGGINGGNR